MKTYYYLRYHIKLWFYRTAIRVLPICDLRGEMIYRYYRHKTEETPNPYQNFNYDHE